MLQVVLASVYIMLRRGRATQGQYYEAIHATLRLYVYMYETDPITYAKASTSAGYAKPDTVRSWLAAAWPAYASSPTQLLLEVEVHRALFTSSSLQTPDQQNIPHHSNTIFTKQERQTRNSSRPCTLHLQRPCSALPSHASFSRAFHGSTAKRAVSVVCSYLVTNVCHLEGSLTS